jgi:Ca2+:H+ antiporter
MGTSAAVNAMFSTIFEVIFYCVALRQGKSELVQGCIIGSILAGVLFLPGLSMCFGALKRKTQRFNSKSAGVTSTMLLFAMIGVFSPTLFYAVYGTYVMRCGDCPQNMAAVLQKDSQAAISGCRTCSISQQLDLNEPLYVEMLKPFSYLCAFLLALAYFIGLWFTLRTHSAVIWNESKERHHDESTSRHDPTQSHGRQMSGSQPISGRPSYLRQNQRLSSFGEMISTPCDVIPEALEVNQQADQSLPENTTLAPQSGNAEGPLREEEAHHVPNWSRRKSLLILVTATVFYCLLAVILIDAVDTILHEFYIEERFLGLTVFALIPNATEIWVCCYARTIHQLNTNASRTLYYLPPTVISRYLWRLAQLMHYKCAFFKYLLWSSFQLYSNHQDISNLIMSSRWCYLNGTCLLSSFPYFCMAICRMRGEATISKEVFFYYRMWL